MIKGANCLDRFICSLVPGVNDLRAILLSDGRLHDIERLPEMPAPLHLLMTGEDDDWDRRLIVKLHPLDNGLERWFRRVPRIAAAHEVQVALDGVPVQPVGRGIGQDFAGETVGSGASLNDSDGAVHEQSSGEAAIGKTRPSMPSAAAASRSPRSRVRRARSASRAAMAS